jgi:hypothetical protein
MRSFKRIVTFVITLLLVFAVSFSFVGCGNTKTPVKPKPKQEQQTTTQNNSNQQQQQTASNQQQNQQNANTQEKKTILIPTPLSTGIVKIYLIVNNDYMRKPEFKNLKKALPPNTEILNIDEKDKNKRLFANTLALMAGHVLLNDDGIIIPTIILYYKEKDTDLKRVVVGYVPVTTADDFMQYYWEALRTGKVVEFYKDSIKICDYNQECVYTFANYIDKYDSGQ